MTSDHQPMNWLELFGVAGTWAAVLAGYGYWRHQTIVARETRRDEMDARRDMELNKRLVALEAKFVSELSLFRLDTTREHDAVTQQVSSVNSQVRDIMRSVSDNFVSRREYDTVTRSTNDQLTDIRKDVGGVGLQVEGVRGRVDELFGKVEFRRTPR